MRNGGLYVFEWNGPSLKSKCVEGHARKIRRYTNDFTFPVVAVRGSMERTPHMNIHRGSRDGGREIYLMLGRKVILLGDHHTFLEQVLEDGDSVLFGHQHFRKVFFNPF